MKSNILVSVIIPVYNAEKFIDKCLKSVIKQTYSNLEVIIINDGSKDGSKEICEKYAKKDFRIKLINKENGGVSSSRNLGIKESNGDYLMFIDSDDWIELNTVQCYIDVLKNNYPDIIQSNYFFNYDNREVINNKEARDGLLNSSNNELKKAIFSISYSNFNNFGSIRWICGKFYKSSLIKNNNIFLNENIYLLEDGIFNLKIFDYSSKIEFINIPLYHYRQLATSASNRYNYDQLNQYDLVLEELLPIAQKSSLVDFYNNTAFEFLITYISRTCNNNSFDKKEIYSLISSVINSDKYKKCVYNLNKKTLSKKEKIIRFFVKNKMIKILYIMSKINKFFK